MWPSIEPTGLKSVECKSSCQVRPRALSYCFARNAASWLIRNSIGNVSSDIVAYFNMMDGTRNRPSFLARHSPSIMVIASQILAAVIQGIVKFLETGTQPVHPFQILQIRLLVTGVGCTLYLWRKKTPDFPLGPRNMRPLLLLRALGGVCGATGFYCMKSPVIESILIGRTLTVLELSSLNPTPHACSGNCSQFPRPIWCNGLGQVSGPWRNQYHRSSWGPHSPRGCRSSGSAKQYIRP